MILTDMAMNHSRNLYTGTSGTCQHIMHQHEAIDIMLLTCKLDTRMRYIFHRTLTHCQVIQLCALYCIYKTNPPTIGLSAIGSTHLLLSTFRSRCIVENIPNMKLLQANIPVYTCLVTLTNTPQRIASFWVKSSTSPPSAVMCRRETVR